jgi:outer membrane protein OmpA-like peptidoglycan-associated protein
MLLRTGTASLIVLLGLLLPSASALAGSHVAPTSVEAGASMNGLIFLDSDAQLGNTFSYRLHGAYNVNRWLGAELGFDFAPKEVNQVTMTQLHLNAIVNLMTSESVVPFVGVGPSFATLIPEAGDRDSDFAVNAVAGLKLYPWSKVGIRLDARYVARLGSDEGEKELESDLIAGVGLFYVHGGAEEVKDVILDTDGDGFIDPEDKCPTTPGVASAGGCPDEDGDTVTDLKDACPKVAGLVELEGCPDADGDKIVDKTDRCPKVPGPEKYTGCPDPDEDTVANYPGDDGDRCPSIPGDPAFGGCPAPPTPEALARFSGVMQGITFEKAKAVIRSKSFKVLGEAIVELQNYKHVIVLIEGHTSSEGSDETNMALSQQRADSVKAYLVSKGVDASRLETKGFGKTKPIASNENKKGREQNRRITFTPLRY